MVTRIRVVGQSVDSEKEYSAMMPTMDELIRLAYQSICKMESWMAEHVRGFERFSKDDLHSFATQLGWQLSEGTCSCHLKICPTRHTIAAWPASNIKLGVFVKRAV